ncbi:MAG TPA: MtrAB system histidine kinase MtrB [Streptosporangiaceae bacterium]|nr:MtrAB system histidine kinase MtrB [Streptosporangiaceae bacterium]
MRGAVVEGQLTGWRQRVAARVTRTRLRRLVRLALRVRRRARAVIARVADRWRSSLQLRVITVTFLVSGLVVVVLGVVLMQQIAQNLVATKERSAVNIASVGLAVAQTWQGASRYPTGDTAQMMNDIVNKLEASGSNSGTHYAVLVRLPRTYQGKPVYSGGASIGFPQGQLPTPPADLMAKVEHESKLSPSVLWYVPHSMNVFGQGQTPGLVYGAPFGSVYEVYYYFPLKDEQQSLAQAQRTMLLVGAVAVVLLAGIAWLVTRWVVVPVRQAARGARLLSTGNLDERMPVRGSDELAALSTSFNEMAASLQEKLRELQDLSQVQRQFVSDVSHELRTPLTTIRIAADVLFAARESMNAAPARSAELLQSQLERFESLLTDLLEISRYDANAATLDAEPVDICDVARQSADVAQQLAERRGTKIEFRLPAEPCIVVADSRRVERILRNLLVNAVEHGENREAVVTVAADSAAVAVAVRDFGVGLAQGEEQLVFDRFWRADPARARTTGGTGLGLSIALEDARLHGGWLEAWGEPGRGSVFRLTLPRVAGEDLVGSPLPLEPGPADVDAVAAALPPDPPGKATPIAGDQPAAKQPRPAAGTPAAAGPASAAGPAAAGELAAGSEHGPRSDGREHDSEVTAHG